MADGLFMTPEMARQAAMERGMLSSAQMAQLPLLNQVVAMGGNAGTMIGSSLGGLFGGRSAFELENEARMQEYQQQKAAEAEKLRQEQALNNLNQQKIVQEMALAASDDDSLSLLDNFTAESVAKYKRSGNIGDLVRVVADKADGTQVVEVNGEEVLINKATGAVIKVLGKARPQTPNTTVVTGTQETAEAKAYGGSLVDNYKTISNRADTASKTKIAFETQLNTLNKGFETGFGTEATAAAASVLAAMGVENAAQFATDAQVFKAAAAQAILTKQLEQKGPQTESDAKRIQQTAAQLGNTKEANIFLAKVGIAQANRDMEQRTFYRKWRTKNKTFEGAEEAWLESEGNKSLFDRPELKQYKRTDPTEGIPRETANPIFATNGKQRIMSTDGGKTWQEVR